MPKTVLFNRDEVLEKVTDLFWRKGYNGTSMQDLVDTTGLNRSSLYNSFGDKYQLYMESLSHYQCHQSELWQNYIKQQESPKAALINFFQSIRDGLMEEQNHNGCFLANCTSELSSVDPQVHEFLVSNKEKLTSFFTSLIKKAQQQNEIDPSKDAKALALYLFSSIQGLMITSMIAKECSEIQIITKQILNNL
ncbi:TetR/AcrR family transcriptional regulator [Fulvivirga ligni]|uniref:TetR/AcrR family transcriptional regulator n=1 Tax=Fulvivirga ligni TaxID=2904246 RepID=UPI001F211B17|nr:TetR/AcrR family transcriptional regulator [Fulvivirga ligni]UII20926.1 TetR/AcrR family transcriptional regulator [Fulvivirga ligni]